MKSQHSGIFKVLYLISLSVVLFFIKDWLLLAVIFTFQALLWALYRINITAWFKALYKLKWFILLILISYSLVAPQTNAQVMSMDLYFFSIKYYPQGASTALLMLARVALMLMTSLWVRLSSTRESFIQAMEAIKLPKAVAIVIDLALNHLTAVKPKNKKSKGKKSKQAFSFQDIKTNKGQFIQKLIQKNHDKSVALIEANHPDVNPKIKQDVIILFAVVAAIMSLKLLQLMPGLPIAPGHKNLLVIPLIMLATLSTNMRFGGLAAGLATGIVSFFLGFGKFGVFEILHFALPGLVADWLAPLIRHSKGKMTLIKLMLMGALIGLSRFAANFSILILVGSPQLAWVIFLPMLTSQIIFGALSSFVCLPVLLKHQSGGWFNPDPTVQDNKKGDSE